MSTAVVPQEPVNADVAEKRAEKRPPIENVRGRLGSVPFNFARLGLEPRPWKRRLSAAALVIPKIRYWEEQYKNFNDEEIRKQSMRLRGKARSGMKIDKLIPEAFGLSTIAIRRIFGYKLFDVQLAAGIVMHYGGLVELATGEGKTLCAVSPAYLNALTGKGVHVTTVNDYLAKRDAEEMGPVYRLMGLTEGVIQQKMEDNDRKEAYKCDVTYGTAAEFGFDFLRDRLKLRGGQANVDHFWTPWLEEGSGKKDPRCQRELNYAIVDEADSIFIDEARTPLIIANPTRDATPEEQVVYKWCNDVVQKMNREEHFRIDLKKDKVELTESGKQMARYANPPTGQHAQAMDKIHEQLEKSLQAHYRFQKDHHYMLDDKGKIVIIDEGTGRPMPDRHWRDGLHQAVEAKESTTITMASEHAAQVTFQNFYRIYKKLAGMSGTLMPNFWELRKVYRRWTTKIPTNRPILRNNMPDTVFPTEGQKFDAVVKQVQTMVKAGRPVLIGTRTVEKSEKLSSLLNLANIDHKVLNARQDKNEAEIVSEAGQEARVTVATNMAGRGTDIKLGAGVGAKGGLHVIGLERHEAERIDRQLVGRAGRQGDKGSGQFFLSLEDQLLEGLGHKKQMELEALGRRGSSLMLNRFRRLFRKAQRRIEKKHYKQRLDLMNYDKQRQEMLQDLGADAYVD
ncbi:preprotein translocase subunit SecA [soil metagenome]